MNAITPTASATAVPIDCLPADPRRSFLLIAATHHKLVETGAESLDEGFDTVVDWLDDVFPPLLVPPRDPPRPKPRPTPQATIEAIVYVVRELGVAGLKEPSTAARLASCDDAARTQINRRIDALKKKGTIQ